LLTAQIRALVMMLATNQVQNLLAACGLQASSGPQVVNHTLGVLLSAMAVGLIFNGTTVWAACVTGPQHDL
jgi:hypothetical protein